MNRPIHSTMDDRTSHPQGGITMFEMLISIVVGAIVAVGLATQVANTVKYSQMVRQQLQATFLVEEKMEEILFLRKTVGTTGINATTLPDEAALSGDFSAYSRHLTFSDDTTGTCPTHTASDCLEVHVTVESGGTTHAGAKVVFTKGGPW
ncbi:MAG: hypothetical protein HW380_2986 [Magnetococcales bacterium]|nr:hypothetical protein [Magnetococcales bacterium]HIJ85857.1 hypothetical protein [Magnetococcales bacterium]